MAVNKVVYGTTTIIDITDSTVMPETLGKGATAYDKSGAKITGTMEQATDPKLQTKTVTPTTAQQAVTPDSGYDGLSKVTVNAMPTATQATPTISVSSAGKITASATQSAGYVSAGTKSATQQLTTQAAKTVTPTTSNQTAVASGRYTTGAITVKGDSNLKAANIKSGVSIFGVAGTHTGGENLDSVIAEQQTLINTLSSVLDSKAAGGGGGSVGTCTVNITVKNDDLMLHSYTSLVDGVVTSNTVQSGAWGEGGISSVTLENVICGSIIVLWLEGVYSFWIKDYDGATEWYFDSMGSAAYPVCILSAPTTNGVTCNIYLECDD